MSLRFIYGRAGSGKSQYCLNSIKNRIEEDIDRPLILLVPEQFSFQAEKNLIEVLDEKTGFKTQVLSFKRMAYRVFNEVGGITAKHMNESGKSMLLYNIIEDNKNNLKVFKKAAKRQGFITTISDIITEFKRYNITPEIILNNLENIEGDNLKYKMEDLALIFSQFETRLHKNYIDNEDDLTILVEKLNKSKQFDNAEIWIDEFSSFSPQEYSVLEKLLLKSYRINITLCTDYLNQGRFVDTTDVFSPIKNTENKLLQIIEDNNIKLDKPIALKCDPCARFKNSSELQHLEKNMFSFPYKEYKNETKDICMLKTLNQFTEIENTAKDIIKLCIDKGCRFKDIAVITGDLEGYENIISSVFLQYNIPFFIDKKREINNNPIIVLILSALEVLSKNWTYESVFRYLKTGLLDINNEEMDILENYVLANGIKGYQWTNDKPWEHKSFSNYELEDQALKELLAKINDIRYKAMEPIVTLNKNFKSIDKAKEFCEVLYEFLCSINLPDKIQNMIEDFKVESEIEKASEYNQIWNIVIEVLDQIVEVIGEEKISLKEFFKILQTGFSEYEIGLIPPTLDQVMVGSITRLRSHNINTLYIVGVNDGIFPSPLKEEGILSDDDREFLGDKGLEIAKDTKSIAFEEQFLVYSTLTTPSKYLRLSYPIADGEGKTLRPSIIISRIKKIFTNICEENDIVKLNGEEEELKKISSAKPTFNYLISNLRKDVEGVKIDNIWGDTYKWYLENEFWIEKLNRLIKGFDYTNQSKYIETKKIRNLYGKPLKISVSRVEKFSQCPFAYFVQYGLKAKDRKIFNLSYPDLGIFMHSILEKFSHELEKKGLEWDTMDLNWAEEEIDKLINEELDNKSLDILNSSKRYEYVTKSVKKILKRSIWLIGEHIKRGNFKPSYYELSFDIDGDYPPIAMELHSGEVINLIGRVDRVDLLQKDGSTYLKIIDYKSGAKEFKLSDVYYGLQLQLLIYLDAILTELAERSGINGEPGALLYLKLDDPIVKNTVDMSDEEIEKSIIKNLKMKGLILNDPNVIRDMDNIISGISDIIPVMVKKDGGVSEGRSSVATKEEFETLRKYVRYTIIEICEEMLEGNIEIKPYKKKEGSSCDYCIYSSVCKFDTNIRGNKYNILIDKKDEEVWDDIKKKLEYKNI
ncbi:ATP-dependent helicase/exonuclease AddB [Clostridium sporogenes]|uniref:helicase-exonuclease AddAB subunit AddB n=1 Tax=Clostridium botulinum TaxID=1491 RepID=UPI000717728C|nr:helicase-exonuclease AddAB subunit AddB [Clostridium botulinum]KRU24205.1 ATP-dependent helicase/exonuclease AddB [Clostridium sporogenes]KRU26204.1 ATP-dependent helicase/exonuclease AddB [Clostridium sporogenes]KRU27260.1 ATP-dependent helicase/exonuclease AddB [Clostridium sporogenes]KRU49120.1 ATP-dependent helicase/exonuclease AddB [Clostridium sporogenes]MBZ1328778.1 helicase-exonuclease AddAB subunit AddB [Clostridium botulinum]